jgi:hypothetical protein
MMGRAVREIEPSRTALTTTPTLEGVRVMAESQYTAAPADGKEVPGFPGYRVTPDGRVWTCWLRGRWPRMTDRWRAIRPATSDQGYLNLHLFRSGHSQCCRVHRLVLEVFVGPCPKGMQCRHLDGNPANNRLENLCWGTRVENAADKRRHGTDGGARGEQVRTSLLTDAIVLEAIQLKRQTGMSYAAIASHLGLPARRGGNALFSALNGWSWTHVTGIPKRTRAPRRPVRKDDIFGACNGLFAEPESTEAA